MAIEHNHYTSMHLLNILNADLKKINLLIKKINKITIIIDFN